MQLFVVALCLWLVNNSSTAKRQSCKMLFDNNRCSRSSCSDRRPSNWLSTWPTVNWLDKTLFNSNVSNCSADTNGWLAVCLFCNAAKCAKTPTKFQFKNDTTKMNARTIRKGKEGMYPWYSANISGKDFVALKEFSNPVVVGRNLTSSQLKVFFDSLTNSLPLFALCIICAALMGLFVWIFVSISFLSIYCVSHIINVFYNGSLTQEMC